jgi:DNA/RNA endonuclease YhcR with UshA esterase domain
MDSMDKQAGGKAPGRNPAAMIGGIVLVLALAGGGGYYAFKALKHEPIHISDIMANPRDFDQKTVTVKGKVIHSFNVLGIKAFELNDGSGTIRVVTERGLPNEGQEVTVTGMVNQMFKIGPAEITVIMESAEGGDQ